MPFDAPPPSTFAGLTLETERLRLRPFQPSDAPAILALFMDRGFLEFSAVSPFQSLAEAEALVARDARQRLAGERLRLGIERRDAQDVVGYCDLFSIDPLSRKGEVGFGLFTAMRGFGFMGEALSAFVRCVLVDLQFNRVMAEIDPANTNSERILRRVGFTKEGQFRENCVVNGVLSDSVFYGLLRRDLSGAGPAAQHGAGSSARKTP